MRPPRPRKSCDGIGEWGASSPRPPRSPRPPWSPGRPVPAYGFAGEPGRWPRGPPPSGRDGPSPPRGGLPLLRRWLPRRRRRRACAGVAAAAWGPGRRRTRHPLRPPPVPRGPTAPPRPRPRPAPPPRPPRPVARRQPWPPPAPAASSAPPTRRRGLWLALGDSGVSPRCLRGLGFDQEGLGLRTSGRRRGPAPAPAAATPPPGARRRFPALRRCRHLGRRGSGLCLFDHRVVAPSHSIEGRGGRPTRRGVRRSGPKGSGSTESAGPPCGCGPPGAPVRRSICTKNALFLAPAARPRPCGRSRPEPAEPGPRHLVSRWGNPRPSAPARRANLPPG